MGERTCLVGVGVDLVFESCFASEEFEAKCRVETVGAGWVLCVDGESGVSEAERFVFCQCGSDQVFGNRLVAKFGECAEFVDPADFFAEKVVV